MGQTIDIKARDGSGSFKAYLALPKSGQGPGIVVMQEILGVNAGMRQICDRLAAEGFMALCPDLFWRQEPGVELVDSREKDWEKAFALYQGFDVDKGIEDVQSSIDALRAQPGCTGKVGTQGYCLGGLLAYLCATRTSTDASVGYYGVGIDKRLEEASSISNPLMLHIAAEDGFVNKEAQAAIAAGLGAHPRVSLHTYAGVDHAFSRPNGMHYDAAAADLANARSLAFLSGALR